MTLPEKTVVFYKDTMPSIQDSMNTNFIYFAFKYLKTKHLDANITLMIKISFISISLATCCLALVVSVMTGFEQATYKKMQSIYPDIIIATHQDDFDLANFEPFIKNPENGIKALCTQKHEQAFLAANNNLQAPAMTIIKGVIPEQETKVSTLENKIIHPKNSTLAALLTENSIIIGCELAKRLDLELQDDACLLFCTDQSFNFCMQFDQQAVIITGILKTGIDELDSGLVLCNQDFFTKVFHDHNVDFIHLKLNHLSHEKSCIQNIQEHLHCDIYSWKELYPTLLSALKLEKYAMGFILLLIVLVASMNIISLLSMIITQKKRDIAILIYQGMKQADVQKIFISISLMIACIATIVGLTIAGIFGFLLKKYPFIKLPDNVYDSEYLPIELEYSVFFVIFIATIVISFFASLFATKGIKYIKIVETLKSI